MKGEGRRISRSFLSATFSVEIKIISAESTTAAMMQGEPASRLGEIL